MLNLNNMNFKQQSFESMLTYNNAAFKQQSFESILTCKITLNLLVTNQL